MACEFRSLIVDSIARYLARLASKYGKHWICLVSNTTFPSVISTTYLLDNFSVLCATENDASFAEYL